MCTFTKIAYWVDESGETAGKFEVKTWSLHLFVVDQVFFQMFTLPLIRIGVATAGSP